MKIFGRHQTTLGCTLLLSFTLLGLAIGPDRVVEAQGESIAATYSGGALSLTIPYHAPRAGRGRMFVEILDPEDRVLGSAVRNTEVGHGDGQLQQEINLDKPLPIEGLVWDRIRYRFEYHAESGVAFEGTRSISQILRPSHHPHTPTKDLFRDPAGDGSSLFRLPSAESGSLQALQQPFPQFPGEPLHSAAYGGFVNPKKTRKLRKGPAVKVIRAEQENSRRRSSPAAHPHLSHNRSIISTVDAVGGESLEGSAAIGMTIPQSRPLRLNCTERRADFEAVG